MMKVVLTLVAMFALCEFVATWFDYSVHFGDCFTINDVTDDHSYQLSWSGYDHFRGCKVSFHGFDSGNPLDSYKVCIKATNWHIVNSAVSLKYYSGGFSTSTFIEKTYSRNYGDPTYKWCADPDDYVDIMLTTSSSSSFQGQITLEVTAVKTYSYYNYGGTVGGAVGGVFVLVAICIIIGIACRRRSYVRKTASYGAPATSVTAPSGFQYQGGYSNPGYPPGQAAPPAYYPASTTGYTDPKQSYQNSTQYPTNGQQPPPYPVAGQPAT
ncbi:uncharacterized protein LOC143070477 [Mytilus galloprovincialis]|uniref:uncharacterized protein LOC143070477 n=1 Tax=Mytilus galloprovincialis TaxID=29158 RepID=UPI003F7B51D6